MQRRLGTETRERRLTQPEEVREGSLRQVTSGLGLEEGRHVSQVTRRERYSLHREQPSSGLVWQGWQLGGWPPWAVRGRSSQSSQKCGWNGGRGRWKLDHLGRWWGLSASSRGQQGPQSEPQLSHCFPRPAVVSQLSLWITAEPGFGLLKHGYYWPMKSHEGMGCFMPSLLNVPFYSPSFCCC